MAFRTLSDVYDDVRFKSGLNSTSLSNANLLRIANKYYRIILRHVVELNEDINAEISGFDLVSGQREYTLPAESSTTPFGGGAIKIQRFEVTYDGINWRVADQISWQQIEGATKLDADIGNQFTKSAPKFALKDRSIWLLPVPGATDAVSASNQGGRLFYIKRPVEMTTTTDVPDLTPDFLDTLSIGMSVDVFESLGRTAEKRDALAWFNARLVEMKRQEQQLGQDEPINLRGMRINYK